MSFKDIAGTIIKVDDKVAFNPPTYKGLVEGYVVKFTPYIVTLKYVDHNGYTRQTNVYPGDCAVLYRQSDLY